MTRQVVTEFYNTTENLESFEKRMVEKYKTFTTYKTTKLCMQDI